VPHLRVEVLRHALGVPEPPVLDPRVDVHVTADQPCVWVHTTDTPHVGSATEESTAIDRR
jgi:hypothetical protein